MLLQTLFWKTRAPSSQHVRVAARRRGTPVMDASTARRLAVRTLAQAPCCSCCDSLIHHVYLRIGSTLFFDDEPSKLLSSFSAAERAFVTPQVLAACIVLNGRERVELNPIPRPLTERPAYQVLAALARQERVAL